MEIIIEKYNFGKNTNKNHFFYLAFFTYRTVESRQVNRDEG